MEKIDRGKDLELVLMYLSALEFFIASRIGVMPQGTSVIPETINASLISAVKKNRAIWLRVLLISHGADLECWSVKTVVEMI